MHDRSNNNYTICPFSHVVPFLQSFSTWALDTHPCAKTPSSAPGKLTSDAFNISIWMQNLGILIRFKGAIPMVGIHTWNCSTGLIAKHCHPHLDYRSPSWIFNGRQMISPTSKPARDAINGWLKAGRFQQRPTLRLQLLKFKEPPRWRFWDRWYSPPARPTRCWHCGSWWCGPCPLEPRSPPQTPSLIIGFQ